MRMTKQDSKENEDKQKKRERADERRPGLGSVGGG